jgi:hypothetical protein
MPMASVSSSSGCWPSADQLLLLQAAVLGPVPAAARFGEWLSRNDVTRIDETSIRLLPAVDFNLRRHGIEHPHASLVAGLRRHALARTHTFLRTSAALIRSLNELQIPCLVLKGAALCRLYAPALSVRPMNDLDLLVPRRHALDAMALLMKSGFRPHAPRPAELIFVRHSTPFSRDSVEIDLHWDVLPESHQLDDAWAFEEARVLDLGDITTAALSPAAQLFHTVAHGLRYSQTRAAWWPLDALFVLRGSPELDFDRLVKHALEHRLATLLYQGLSYLTEHLQVEVPGAVLTRLKEAPRSPTDWLEHTLRMNRFEPLGEFPQHLVHYRRLSSQLPLGERVRGLPLFLGRTWQLDGDTNLSAELLRKAAARLRVWLASRAVAGARHGPQDDTRPR